MLLTQCCGEMQVAQALPPVPQYRSCVPKAQMPSMQQPLGQLSEEQAELLPLEPLPLPELLELAMPLLLPEPPLLEPLPLPELLELAMPLLLPEPPLLELPSPPPPDDDTSWWASLVVSSKGASNASEGDVVASTGGTVASSGASSDALASTSPGPKGSPK
jgi:hypothetical protein